MQGIYILDGEQARRPRSKKEVRELTQTAPARVHLEATSLFGDEYSGPVTQMPPDVKAHFVGPDPYTRRNFYGSIMRRGERIIVS